MSIAAVVVASYNRMNTTFRDCLNSVRDQPFDEIVVVADFPVEAKGVKSFVVEPMLRNTVDALVKRDVGYMATLSDSILYLCDDHALHPQFLRRYREEYERRLWSVLVPARYTDHGTQRYWLNVGENEGYAGGHASIEKRAMGYVVPWASTAHHRNWDAIRSAQLGRMGAHFVYAGEDLAVEDLEPEAQPWFMTDDQQEIHNAFHRDLKAGKIA